MTFDLSLYRSAIIHQSVANWSGQFTLPRHAASRHSSDRQAELQTHIFGRSSLTALSDKTSLEPRIIMDINDSVRPWILDHSLDKLVIVFKHLFIKFLRVGIGLGPDEVLPAYRQSDEIGSLFLEVVDLRSGWAEEAVGGSVCVHSEFAPLLVCFSKE